MSRRGGSAATVDSQPRLFGLEEIGADTAAAPPRPRDRKPPSTSPSTPQAVAPTAQSRSPDLTDDQAEVIELIAGAMARGALAKARREV